jgi:hypothetical protein
MSGTTVCVSLTLTHRNRELDNCVKMLSAETTVFYFPHQINGTSGNSLLVGKFDSNISPFYEKVQFFAK